MSGQKPDYFYYNNKKCVLIDVEKGKQLIEHGSFNIPDNGLEPCSHCCRGYIATYYVEDKHLYGFKQNYHSWEGEEISGKVPVYFTGSCIIACGSTDNGTDFLESYLKYTRAYELHFTNGKLDEENELALAIKEAKKLLKICKSNYDRYLSGSASIARKYLKYEYDYLRTYKWRNEE